MQFEDVFEIVGSLVLEENGEVLTVLPRLFPDEPGGLLVADIREQQVRAYDAQGALHWYFGRCGDGPGEFQNIAAVTRVSKDLVVAVQGAHKAVLYNPVESRILRTFSNIPLGQIAQPILTLGYDQVLLHSTIVRPGESGLHVLDLTSGRIARSFFRPYVTPVTQQAILAPGAGTLWSALRGDTIASVFVLSDTIYLHNKEGQELEKIRCACVFTAPQSSFSYRRSFRSMAPPL